MFFIGYKKAGAMAALPLSAFFALSPGTASLEASFVWNWSITGGTAESSGTLTTDNLSGFAQIIGFTADQPTTAPQIAYPLTGGETPGSYSSGGPFYVDASGGSITPAEFISTQPPLGQPLQELIFVSRNGVLSPSPSAPLEQRRWTFRSGTDPKKGLMFQNFFSSSITCSGSFDGI